MNNENKKPLKIQNDDVPSFSLSNTRNDGLLVGPRHPYFDTTQNLNLNLKWDPIAPQGVQGWSPNDFKKNEWNSNAKLD
jgi:hypothetical protein